MSAPKAVVLRVAGLVVEGGGRRLLDDVGFEFAAGEIVVVAGPSGAGKTTLLNALLGFGPAGGRLAFATYEASTSSGALTPRDASDRAFDVLRRSAFGFLPQTPAASLDPLRAIGDEIRDALLRRGADASPTAVAAALSAAGLAPTAALLRARPHQLSGGEAQRAAIAVAHAGGPRLVLLDEPTSALDATVAADVLRRLRADADAGRVAAIVVTHDAHVASAVADRVLVLADGRVAEAAETATFFATPRSAAGRAFVAAARDAESAVAPSAVSEGPPLLVAHAVAKSYAARGAKSGGERIAALRATSIDVRRGEVLAVVGESGSGKSTLARLLALIEKPDQGRVHFDGPDAADFDASDLRRVRRRLRMAWQDALLALDPRRPAGDAVDEALRAAGVASSAERAARLSTLAREVGLEPACFARRPEALSGGERQRVLLASAVAADPEALVLDEAFAGVDDALRREIAPRLLRRGDGSPRTVVLVAHDLPLVRALADRVLVLARGAPVELGTAAEVLSEPLHPETARLVDAALPASPSGREAWLARGGTARPPDEARCYGAAFPWREIRPGRFTASLD